MGYRTKMNGKLSAILIGAGGAIILCLIGLAGVTQMVVLEKVGERGIGIMVPILLVLSSLLGCQIASIAAGNNQMVAIGATTGILLLVMIVAAFSVDGEFKDVLINTGAVVTGGVISCVLCLKKPPKWTKKKRRYR